MLETLAYTAALMNTSTTVVRMRRRFISASYTRPWGESSRTGPTDDSERLATLRGPEAVDSWRDSAIPVSRQ